MLRGLLSMFLMGRLFRMFSGRRRPPVHHRSLSHYGRGRGGHFGDLVGLMGLGRRRRSFI